MHAGPHAFSARCFDGFLSAQPASGAAPAQSFEACVVACLCPAVGVGQARGGNCLLWTDVQHYGHRMLLPLSGDAIAETITPFFGSAIVVAKVSTLKFGQRDDGGNIGGSQNCAHASWCRCD